MLDRNIIQRLIGVLQEDFMVYYYCRWTLSSLMNHRTALLLPLCVINHTEMPYS